jgi:hypothetical protein
MTMHRTKLLSLFLEDTNGLRFEVTGFNCIVCVRVQLFEPVHGSAPDITGMGIANPTGKKEKRHFFWRHLEYIKCMFLPRQARDKHRENSKKSGVFRRSIPVSGDDAGLARPPSCWHGNS